jgi:hypothetical protein
MSVASKNLFALLDGKFPPLSSYILSPPTPFLFLPTISEDSQEAPSAPAPKQESVTESPPSGTKSQNQRSKGPASRGGRYYQRGGKPSSTPAAGDNAEENANTEARKKRGSFQCSPQCSSLTFLHRWRSERPRPWWSRWSWWSWAGWWSWARIRSSQWNPPVCNTRSMKAPLC